MHQKDINLVHELNQRLFLVEGAMLSLTGIGPETVLQTTVENLDGEFPVRAPTLHSMYEKEAEYLKRRLKSLGIKEFE